MFPAFLLTKTGLSCLAGVALMAAVIGGYFYWRSEIRDQAKLEVQKEVLEDKVQEQVQAIENMGQTADKLKKVNNAKNTVRRTARDKPDSLYEDDGFRREDWY